MYLAIGKATVMEVRDNRQSKDFPSDTTTIELAESGVREKSVIRVKVPGQIADLFTGDAVSLEAEVRSKLFQGKVFLTAEHYTITHLDGSRTAKEVKNK